MKLTTKGRYGLRAAIDLAMYAKTEPVSLSDVAERQNISISYLEQLISKLKRFISLILLQKWHFNKTLNI